MWGGERGWRVCVTVTSVQDNSIATGNTRDGSVKKQWEAVSVLRAVFAGIEDGKKYGASVARR